jgi:hypothetical protein
MSKKRKKKKRTPRVYLHSSESMEEVKDNSVTLLLGASVYLGKHAPWEDYARLYKRVYCEEGQRILREDGVFIVLQTDAYQKGKFVPRLHNLLSLLLPEGWTLLDRKVWIRQKANMFQVPFSDVLIFAPPGGTTKRTTLNKDNKEWFQGAWQFSPSGEADNAYPAELCRLIVKSTTEKDDLVADPFAGSAKLGGVAHAMGRQYVGYEISEELVPTILQNGCTVIKDGEAIAPKKKGLVW